MQDISKTLWWRGLVFAAGFTVMFGLAMVFLPDLTQWYFNSIIFGTADNPFDVDAKRYIVFAFGVLGAVMIGWAVSLLILIFIPLRRGEIWAWWTIAASIMIWFVIDSAFSVISDYSGNAVSNGAFLLIFALPMYPAYRHLTRKA